MNQEFLYEWKKRACCQMVLAAGVLLLLAAFVFGTQIFSAFRISELEKQMPEGEVVSVRGVISKKLRTKEGCNLVLKVTSGNYVLLSLADQEQCEKQKIGQHIKVEGKVLHFQNAPNPGNFNQKFYYKKQKIQIGIQHAKIIEAKKGERFLLGEHWKERLWRIQQRGTEICCAYMGEKCGGVLGAMLLGEDVYLQPEWKEGMQKSGIGHLLAISALHVSFMGSGLYRALRKSGGSIACSSIIAGLFLSGYVVMSGGSVSAIRAGMMFLVRMGAEMSGREYDGATALALSGGILLWYQPAFLLDAGFLLSFGAVCGIYLGIFMRKYLRHTSLVMLPVGGAMISLFIQILILPIQLYFFYEICPYSIFWNLAAIPLASVVMGCGLSGLICHMVGIFPESVTRCFFLIAKGVILFYKEGSEWVLELPGARLITGRPDVVWMVLYYAVLLLAILFYKNKYVSGICKIGAVFVVCLLLFGNQPKSGELQIIMLNVGQGDSFVIRTPEGSTCLIDGGSSDVKGVGQYRMEPYLKQAGVKELDYVWVTHGDLDHLNGIKEMLERKRVGIPIRRMIFPPERYWEENLSELVHIAKEGGSQIHIMKRGQVWKEGEMQMQCIWPEESVGPKLEGNEASLVLGLRYRAFSMLFTGDLEKDAEEQVAQLLTGPYEVLKAGHHGSKYATGEALLNVVDPACVWISAGEKNRYGHPHQEVLERLAKRGITRYNTKDRSTVCLRTDGKKYEIECLRDRPENHEKFE